jgi:hypothetical protein
MIEDGLIFCDECGTWFTEDEFDDIFTDEDDGNICRSCIEFLEQEDQDLEDECGGEA